MAYILKFQVTGDQEAINKSKRVFNESDKSANASAGKIKDRFRDVFENVTQNATGAFGSVAGGLFKLPGAAGIAAAGVLAAFGGMVAAAKKYAEANAANDAASAKFLATVDKLKSGFSSVVNFIGEKAVGALVKLAGAFGAAATAQETLLRQQKAYDELVVKQVSNVDAFVKKLNEQLDAEKRLLETGIVQDYFDAFAKGDTKLANIYAQNLNRLRTQQKMEADLIAIRNQEIKPQVIKQQIVKQQDNKGNDIDKFIRARDAALRGVQTAGFESVAKVYDKITSAETIIALQNIVAEVNRQDEAQKRVAAELKRQKQIYFQFGNALRSQVIGGLEQALFEARKLNDVFKEIVNAALRIGFRLLAGNIIPGFSNGGILGRIPQAASGMVVNRDSLIRVGERNLPEAIIPLAPQKSAQRRKVMQAAGLAGDSGVNISFSPTIYANSADRNFARELMVEFNRQVKRGVKLTATQYGSNRQ